MLPVILLILKVIGIILLSLIGLLLLLLLTVLLIPVRYRVAVTHGEHLNAEGRVGWLFHLIGAGFTYFDGDYHIRVRVLWFILYDNLRPKQKKPKKKRHKAARKKKKRAGKAAVQGGHNQPAAQNAYEQEESDIIQKDIAADSTAKLSEEPASHTFVKKDHAAVISKRPDLTRGKEKISVFQKVYRKLKNIKSRITAFFKGIKRKITAWIRNIGDIRQKIGLVTEFMQNERNKEGFQVTLNSLRKLLKHLLPTQIKSRLVFGTGDPCSTGQALGVLGMFYGLYRDKVVIIPDFEKKRLEGEHRARGRIRLITILIIVIKLMFDKRFKQLRNSFKILKEAL